MSRPSTLELRRSSSTEKDTVAMPPAVPHRVMTPTARSPTFGFISEAQSLNFYHGRIMHNQVESLLKPYMDKRGTYLLRDSNTEGSALTISVVDNPKHIYHFKVNCKLPGLYEVTERNKFQSLRDLIDYFQINEVPGQHTSQLRLLYPVPVAVSRVRRGSQDAAPTSPPRPRTSPPPQRLRNSPPRSPPRLPNRSPSPPPRPPRLDLVNRREQQHPQPLSPSFINSRPPVPIPEPGQEPMYIHNDHIYCRAESIKRSRIDDIMELCKISDQKYKKCTCGLYMDQSELVDNWMMHIDRPDGDHAGTGRVFFVNPVSNVTTWELPETTLRLLSSEHLDKYKFVKELMREGSSL